MHSALFIAPKGRRGKVVVNIAIIEDEQGAADLLTEHLRSFEKNEKVQFSITHFGSAITFLTNYRAVFDIVFMDIELPDLSGMDAAVKLREIDSSVILIFVTNLAQFAVKGYEVDALDFVVKPVSYYVLSLKLRRAIERLGRRGDAELKITVDDAIVRVKISDVKYIEVQGHKLVYHTAGGDLKTYGSLKKTEELLADANFERCNACYLVNLKYVTAIKGYTLFIGSEELQISHAKRKDFVRTVNDYMGWCR